MGKADCTFQFGLNMKITTLIVLIVLVKVNTLNADTNASQQETFEDEIDPISLAAVLIEDKHYERAKTVLSAVNIKKQTSGFDFARFHLLQGLVYLELSEYEDSVKSFNLSIKAGQKDKVVYLFLAQGEYRLKNFAAAVSALEKAGEEAEKAAGLFIMKADCYRQLGQKDKAIIAIGRGIELFRDDETLRKTRILLWVDMGLYQQANHEGNEFLKNTNAKAEEYVSLAEALLKSKQYEQARLLLETARLIFPENEDITIQLAKAYIESGNIRVAASLFEHASHLSGKLALDASELYRRAGHFTAALRMNARVTDQKAKVKQRLGLLIETERFEEASTMASRLERLGLLEEDSVKYGLAYAFFMIGKFNDAERYLKAVSDGILFEKAVQLRRIMGSCSTTKEKCP